VCRSAGLRCREGSGGLSGGGGGRVIRGDK